MLLYRFRPFNQHTITELLTEKLHFSHPSTWNDPFEYDALNTTQSLRSSTVRYACFAQNKSDEEEDAAIQNILMWSHYADSHKGICVEYEQHLISALRDGHKIRYQQQKEGLYYKNRCWKYENEYRMMAKTDKKDFQGVDIPYSEIDLKIKAIYCGVKFEESQLETLDILRGERDFEIFTGNHLSGILQYYNSIEFTKLVRLKGLVQIIKDNE